MIISKCQKSAAYMGEMCSNICFGICASVGCKKKHSNSLLVSNSFLTFASSKAACGNL